MADTNIDYFEVDEYGAHFVEQSAQLVGKSPLVDVALLAQLVDGARQAVAAELKKQGITKSDVRGGRKDVEALAETLRKEIERFHKHLGTLDDDVKVDRHAYFAGGKLGKITALKPADLVKKATKVLDGFDVPANAALPDGAKWKGKLTKARDALGAAVSGKGAAATQSIQHTAALAAAHEAFLATYNGVAKRLVYGLLVHLGRKDEHRLFFKDLQVDEGGAPVQPPSPEPPIG